MAKKKIVKKKISDIQEVKSEETVENIKTEENSSDNIYLELLKQINDLKAQVNENKNKPVAKEDGEETEEDILADYLEAPVFFYVYSSYYRISSDFRRGRVTKLPIGSKLEFETVIRRKIKKGKAEGVLSVARCEVRSKKNVEWLREHTLYGIAFHEELGKVTDTDAMFALEMSRISNRVKSMPDAAVISSCKSRGIPMNPNIDSMRMSLIHSLANRNAEASKQKAKQFAESTHPEFRIDNAQKIGLDGGTSSSSNIY